MTLHWTRSGEQAGEWTARLRSGREVRWSGFFTGPLVLPPERIATIACDLLGVPVEKVTDLAAAEIESFVAGPGRRTPSLIMHSATQTTRGFDGDLADVAGGRRAYDVATYLEARAVTLGREGDLAVGRTAPWREAVRRAGIDFLDVGGLEHYYLSHALLVAAHRHGDTPQPALDTMIDWLRRRPDAVVRLYALDLETQILLLWLKRRAGLPRLRVDANDPVVSGRWNNKTHVHPTVERARRLRHREGLTPTDLLVLEQRETDGHRRLGMEIPVLPGYLVPRGDDPEEFAAGMLEAAALLRRRYGVAFGCLKPAEAGDGARIVPHLNLNDPEPLRRHALRAHENGDDHVLEVHLELLTFGAAGRVLPLAPSGHIRNGHVADGLTAQILNGCSWEGNASFDESTCADLGVLPGQYARMVQTVEAVHAAFSGPQSVAEGCHQGLVTGGIDFLLGRAGGAFGDRVLLGAVDFNLSSHGAEYMRAFHAEVRGADPHACVATRVYSPARSASLAATDEAVAALAATGQTVTTVGCVPGRWGMVATTGPDPRSAIQNAFELVRGLRERGLAEA